MSVELEPLELGFRRPFTQEVSEVLSLRNPHSEPIAFKVKTTAPKQYCVRPNSGRIEPGKNVQIQVLLQAMKEDPPPDAKCRDKFLVQSVAVPANQEMSNTAAIWSAIEQSNKSSIQEKKIRVSFLPAEGAASTPARAQAQDEPPAYSSPVSNAATPSAAPMASVTKNDHRPSDSKSSSEAVKSTAVGASVGAAAAGIASAIPNNTEELKAQLEDAKASIARLTKQVQDQGLRQRNTGGAQEKSTVGEVATSVQQNTPNGVPVPVTAALCLLSFLLAYLFF